ncbi:hypothetical protein GEMRC1_007870 [Eukaryota sp. GEM-RC1]
MPVYDELTRPHVESYNFFLNEALNLIPKTLNPVPFEIPGFPLVSLWINSITIHEPTRPGASDTLSTPLLPRDAREGSVTYGGILEVDLCRQIGDSPPEHFNRRLGVWPLMLRSSLCHLSKLDEDGIIAAKENVNEPGGFFIINGLERLIRLLIVNRRHYPITMVRGSWSKRGPRYTDFGVSMRCVRPDESAVSNSLHYLEDGNVTLRFSHRKAEYFVSLSIILRALIQCSDRQIYETVVARAHPSDKNFVRDRMELLLLSAHNVSLFKMEDARIFIGRRFRSVLDFPVSYPDQFVGKFIIDNYIMVHLTDDYAKFDILMEMLRKLYSMVNGTIAPDNGDSSQHHELLLPGHLTSIFLKEQLSIWLSAIKNQIIREHTMKPQTFDIHDQLQFKKCIDRSGCDLGRKFEYLLATGNIRSESGLDLMQQAGFSIVAERINQLRYLAHFRSVHRGQFFTEMKTTVVRKLLPESWGFLCPVHTPDGTPCGLLLHLAADCHASSIESSVDSYSTIVPHLISLGVVPMNSSVINVVPECPEYLPVYLDGRVVGFTTEANMADLDYGLRKLKSCGQIPVFTEIAVVPSNWNS